MTAEKLAEFAGILLSLSFSYVPGLKEKYEELDGIYKRLIMGGALLAVAGAVFGLSCAGIIGDVVCSEAGAIGLVRVFIAALIANQATYLLVGSGVSETA